MIFYLAYGSNLNQDDMAHRCPDAEPDGWLVLTSARLTFRRVADIACEPGYQTPVGIWRISKRDEERLDTYEGVKNGLYSKYWLPFSKGKALIYLMNERGIAPPSTWYYETIRQGYRDFGLDHRYLTTALNDSWGRKDETDYTRRRRSRDANVPSTRTLKMPLAIALKHQAKVNRGDHAP